MSIETEILDLYVFKRETSKGTEVFPDMNNTELLESLIEQKLIEQPNNNKYFLTEKGIQEVKEKSKELYNYDITEKRKQLLTEIRKTDSKYQYNNELNNIAYLLNNEEDIKHTTNIIKKLSQNKQLIEEKPVLYLGAYDDIGTAFLFPAKEFYFVDLEYEKSTKEKIISQLKKLTDNCVVKEKEEVTTIDLEGRTIHLIKGDFTKKEEIKHLLPEQYSGIIIKKTSRTNEAEKYFQNLIKGGYFLEADIQVNETLRGFKQKYTGYLPSKTIFGDAESVSTPAKLWKKKSF